MAPIRTQRLMRATVGKFLKLYEAPFFPFRSLSDRAVDLELVSSTAVTGEQLLAANNIAGAFANDIIQASTRVNYGQNLGLIHGLETMVCMAIEGAMQIEGGNWQIFSRMLNASTATVLLDTTVASIKKTKGKYTLTSTPANSSATEIKTTELKFDTVVLAAPLQFAKVDIKDGLVSKLPDEVPYVRLEVTLFASPHKLDPTYFNLKPDEPCPDSILTTLSPEEDPSNRENIVGKSGFFSISTLRTLINPSTGSKEYIYKIFSPKPVDAKFLSNILGIKVAQEVNDLIENPTKDISWFFPKTWHSYPYEFPRVTFEQIELARGFYYTSGIESFISTMETSALMGMNVAQLIMDDYLELLGGMPNKEGQDPKVVEDL
jgi:prenylcysteine oxidase/farnesylcysteine lyase